MSGYVTTYGAFPPYAVQTSEIFRGGWFSRLELPLDYLENQLLDNPAYSAKSLQGVFQCPLNRGQIITVHFETGSGAPPGTTEELQVPSLTAYAYNAWGIVGGPTPEFPNGLGLGDGNWKGLPPHHLG